MDFKLKEYDTCITERNDLIKEMNRLEGGCLILVGVISSWLISAEPSTVGALLYKLSWMLPMVITFCCMMRVKALNKMLEIREEYIQKLESQLIEKKEKNEGLYNFQKQQNKKVFMGKTMIGVSATLFWIILYVFTAGIYIYKIIVG